MMPDQPLKVLIVDDSPIIVDRLSQMLNELCGVEVAGEAGDVSQGIRAFRSLRPDLVLLDIHLARGTGLPILQCIKHDHPAATVIVLTNYDNPQYRQLYVSAGADYFFDKSADFNKIAAVIAHMQSRIASRSPSDLY